MNCFIKPGLVFGMLLLPVFLPARQLQDTWRSSSVSSAHPLATAAGERVLRSGGNAFDASIAIAATLNVVEPMMSGIGGYGTILIYHAETGKLLYLNSSGRFPLATNTDLMREPTPDFMKNRFGPKSISTPGNLNAWAVLHKRFGMVAWESLFSEAITHADAGFKLSESQAYMIAGAFKDFSPYAKSFYGKENAPLKPGEMLVQADLGKTFRKIAAEGPAIFYTGSIANAIDRKMKEVESFLSLEDLKRNEAEWSEPITIRYKEFDIYTAAPPANSFAAFVNIGLMEQLNSEKLAHNSPAYLHLFAEMTKQSYKARLLHSFDPEIEQPPLDSILSTDVLKMMVHAIDRKKASDFQLSQAPESRHTTHFVVVDAWGNVVSATQTLGNEFGSRIMIDGTGIWMNNSMAYSTFEPKGNPMDAFPGRHKLSGDCPIIIMKNKKPWAALGSPGGHTITQNVPQIIFNLIDFNMSMQEAIDAPKIAFAEPKWIIADTHMPGQLINSLKEKGHIVIQRTIGNAHGIKILRDKNGKIIAFDIGVDKRAEVRAPVIDR